MATDPFSSAPIMPETPRPLWRSIRRGLVGRCPRCGEGRLFKSFLTAAPSCGVCGQALDVHRADDLPAYLTILIVGKTLAAGIVATETTAPLSLTASYLIWPPLGIVMALLLLGRIKGAVIGLQWAHRMHGFADDPAADDAARRYDGGDRQEETRPSASLDGGRRQA